MKLNNNETRIEILALNEIDEVTVKKCLCLCTGGMLD